MDLEYTLSFIVLCVAVSLVLGLLHDDAPVGAVMHGVYVMFMFLTTILAVGIPVFLMSR